MKHTPLLVLIFACCHGLFAQQSGCPAAYAQFEKGQYDAAVQSYTICLASYPDDYFSLYNRGICYEKMEDFEKANTDYWKAIEIAPSFLEPLKRMAEKKLENGNTQGALDIVNQAISKSNNSAAGVFNYRGWIYFNQEKYKLAFQDFDKAIQLDSLYASAYNNRASTRYLLQDVAEANEKDLELAVADYQKALRLDSNQSGIWRNLAYVKILLKDYQEALGLLQKASKESKEDPMIFIYSAQAENGLGNTQKALQAYKKALEINPKLYGSRLEMAEIFFIQEDWGKLESELMLFENAPEKYQAQAEYLSAKMWAVRSENEKAFKALKKAKSLNYFDTRKKVIELKETEVFGFLKSNKRFKKWLGRL